MKGRGDDRRVRCLGLLLVTVLFLDGEQFFAATALCGGEGRHVGMRVRGISLHNMILLRCRVLYKWLRPLFLKSLVTRKLAQNVTKFMRFSTRQNVTFYHLY
jgi:hypothetical protein